MSTKKKNTAARVIASAREAAGLRDNDGVDAKGIAKRLGRSATYVRGLFMLADAGTHVHDLVLSEKVSASLAIEHLRKHGDKAQAALHRHVEKAAQGIGRVKPRHLPGAAVKRAVRRIAPALVAAVRVLETDPVYLQVAKRTRQTVGSLMNEVQQAEETEAGQPPHEKKPT